MSYWGLKSDVPKLGASDLHRTLRTSVCTKKTPNLSLTQRYISFTTHNMIYLENWCVENNRNLTSVAPMYACGIFTGVVNTFMSSNMYVTVLSCEMELVENCCLKFALSVRVQTILDVLPNSQFRSRLLTDNHYYNPLCHSHTFCYTSVFNFWIWLLFLAAKYVTLSRWAKSLAKRNFWAKKLDRNRE